MACPQCEWEIFQTGRYEPSLHGRGRSFLKLEGRRPSGKVEEQRGITKSSSFRETTTTGRARRSLRGDAELGLVSRGDHITTRIFARRQSLIQSHDTSHLERSAGELIQQKNVQSNSIGVSTQSLCQICSLDLRKYSQPHSDAISLSSPLYLNENGLVTLKQPFSSHPSQLVPTLAVPVAVSKDPSQSTPFEFEDLNMLCTIGTGTFGRVKLVQHRVSGEVYALKCLKKEDILRYHQQQNILNEKRILFLCSDSHFISQLYATYNRPNAIYMLMEYIQGGELLTHLYDRDDTIPHGPLGGFTLPCIQFYAANLIEIFLFFESKNILYRDLKPENILLDRQGWLKIVDFGFAKQLQAPGAGSKTFTLCGTQNYLAPEMILSIGYDRAVDYWALGCLLYELLLALPPFDAEFIVETYQLITAYKHATLPFPEDVDPTFISLINSLLIPDPSCRLGNLANGVKDISDHLFFQEIEWNAISGRSCVPPYVPQLESEVDTSNFFDFDQQEDGGGGPTEVDDALPYEGRQDYFDGFS